jgi:exportin-T
MCVAILRRMAEDWGGVPTFNTLLFEQITPRLFEMAMTPTFDTSDAVTNALAGEIAKVLKLIHIKTGPTFITFLAQVYFPSIQCPPDAAQQFVQHLEKSPIKQFTDVFKEFTRASKFLNLRTS